MNILIVGCGRSGLRLALDLDQGDYDVAVVDADADRLAALGEDFGGLSLCGSPIDKDVLIDAGCESADYVAVVTNDDNMNIMCGQILQNYFGLKKVFVRILDPELELAYKKLGLNTVCPTRFVADTLFGLFTEQDEKVSTVALGTKFAQFETIRLPRRAWGLPAGQLELEAGQILFGIQHADGEIQLGGQEEALLREGDSVILARIKE